MPVRGQEVPFRPSRGRLSSGVGYVQVGDDLAANLDLAEKHATVIARHLINRGASSERIHVVAREIPSGEAASARVEVHLVETID
jgi:hypothetical protein